MSKQLLIGYIEISWFLSLPLQFVPITLDLAAAKAADYEAALDDHFGVDQSNPPGQALIFHNAGSLGALKYLRDMDDVTHLSPYFSLNIRSR